MLRTLPHRWITLWARSAASTNDPVSVISATITTRASRLTSAATVWPTTPGPRTEPTDEEPA